MRQVLVHVSHDLVVFVQCYHLPIPDWKMVDCSSKLIGVGSTKSLHQTAGLECLHNGSELLREWVYSGKQVGVACDPANRLLSILEQYIIMIPRL